MSWFWHLGSAAPWSASRKVLLLGIAVEGVDIDGGAGLTGAEEAPAATGMRSVFHRGGLTSMASKMGLRVLGPDFRVHVPTWR